MNEVWLSFYSVGSLSDKNLWNSFLPEVENISGINLTHLDVNDPVRKKVSDLRNVGEYICAFGEKESSRHLFGKFGRSRITTSIYLSKAVGERSFPNSVKFYFPLTMLKSDQNVQILLDLFGLGIKRLNPFYAYGDITEQISAKRKLSRRAVSLQAELIGMFWLTYINQAYVNYFGEQKVERLPKLAMASNVSGTVCRLGALPGTLESISLRRDAEETLGRNSFVDPKLENEKPKGLYALTYEQLRA